jgi:hypothetical protein
MPHTGAEHMLRVFENRALKEIFEFKREEKTGEWIRLHGDKLYVLNFSPNIIRVTK